MSSETGKAQEGQTAPWKGRKRWLWTLSLLYPMQPLIAIALHASTNNSFWLVLPLLSNYLIAPVVDGLIGVDSGNPPDQFRMQHQGDSYYRRLTYITVLLHYLTLIIAVGYATTQSLSWWAFGLIAVSTGIVAGLAINTGHELGHKNSKFEKQLAKFALAVPAYGHFTVDHNRGHHKNVATYLDSSSARMGESIYKFARREIPGAFANAWATEMERLASRGRSVWGANNQILHSYTITTLLAGLLLLAFGWKVLPFLAIHTTFAYWQLTSANYIEHYGLLRLREDDGKLERCQHHHSWNSGHILSNLVLFNLQRHSDHHLHPLRRYQGLQNYDDWPQLPNGYFGMYLLAYIPWLWFRVMDERLLALPHIDGDLERVNIDRAAKPSIFLKYGRDTMVEPTYTDLPGI